MHGPAADFLPARHRAWSVSRTTGGGCRGGLPVRPPCGKYVAGPWTCSSGVEYDKIKRIIKDFFYVHVLNIDAYYFTRGN